MANIELTYVKYFDEADNNEDLLKLAGVMATSLYLPNNRITDRWGGIYGAPSSFVPLTAYNP